MDSFRPPSRVLMGPGPSDVHPSVLAAMARPTIGHLDPSFTAMMEDLKQRLRRVFRTGNEVTFPVSAPGSAGMECCFVNLVEPGDTVIVCRNGVFGDRMRQNVVRCGGRAVVVDDAWGTPVDPAKVEQAVREHGGAKALAFVHAETSTGVRSDAATLCGIARKHGLLSIVDTVTSLGGIEVEVDAWGADAVYAGSQKCLSCPPGLSPVTFSDRAVELARDRAAPVQSWFLDLGLVLGYWGPSAQRVYHHTAPVNALFALHEALLLLEEEGLENAWARHRRGHLALRAGLEAMGLELPVEEEWRLPQLNLVSVPAGLDEAAARHALLERFGLEIGAGLGVFAGSMWRIGLMGQSCTDTNVLICLGALEAVLAGMDAGIETGVALSAAREVLAR